MFRRAMANQSTSPNFVLVTIRDARRGSTRLVCVEAPFLEGALQREHRLDSSDAGRRQLRHLILSSSDWTYTLSKPDALANVSPRYSPEVLEKVRALLSSRSNAELKRPETLDDLYVGKRGESYQAYRNAIAHVLLERGILCKRGCIAGELIVDR